MTSTRRYLCRGALLLAAAALGACASSAPMVRYYTLQAPAQVAGADAGLLIQVLPIQVPAQVDVPELVIRQGAGQLARVESEQWIAPLPTEVRGALSLHLQRKLGARDVQGLPLGDAAKVHRVRVAITRFDAYLGHRVDLDATWTLSASGEAVSLTCSSRVRESVQAGYPALVAGYQRALALVGDDIAAAVSGSPSRCPASR